VKAKVLIVPGIGDSSPSHWQSLWQDADPGVFSRIELSPAEWEEPRRERWVGAIAEAMQPLGAETILVAHSLGCLAVAHWAATPSARAGGALLVSPPDPAQPAFPNQAISFSPVPIEPLPFPSIVVASSNDPYLTVGHARVCAEIWRSRFHDAGPEGHLSASDGLGDWPAGRALLGELRREV
jgi:uncharacterized protein